MKWQCRWSPTLGDLEGTHQKVWGTDDYTDQERPTVFFGLYSFSDFHALWLHQGIKEILWCGSDITRFVDGFWLEDEEIRIPAVSLSSWLSKHCGHWVENEVERQKLLEVDIHARVCPSFLGNENDFEVSFTPGNKVYTSVSGDEFELYGWHRIPELAWRNKHIEFHLYGNQKAWELKDEDSLNLSNIVIHGRVPREKMNEEIKGMQGALRLTEFDGFSELISKAMLWGQYAFSLIEYPFVDKVSNLSSLLYLKSANIEGRNWYRKHLNQFPWNSNIK